MGTIAFFGPRTVNSSTTSRPAVNVSDDPEGTDGAEYWYSRTDQVIVTRNRKLLGWPRLAEAAEPIAERPGLPVFTDAHHNLLRILK